MSLIGNAKLNILLRLRESPTYGYVLQDELELNLGTVYVHLEELVDAGVIEVDREEDDRTYYRLSENGELLLEALDE